MPRVEFRSVVSRQEDFREAVRELVSPFAGGEEWHLALLFGTPHHGEAWEEILAGVHEALVPAHLIGCAAAGVIGPGTEIEDGPALVLWAARLPGARLHSFYLDQEDLEKVDGPEALRQAIGVPEEPDLSFILVPDPFTCDAERLLKWIDAAYPGAVVTGGMASGGSGPGEGRLFLADQVFPQGAIGLALAGKVRVRPVVSQGCRPVGKPFVVTRAHQNVIDDLGGRPAYEALQETFQAVPDADKTLMRSGLQIGRVVDETLGTFKSGDFLIRALMGAVEGGGLAVNDVIRPGRTVQFHVRDSRTASDEMKALLAAEIQASGRKPAGGLLFNCNGRGERMFGEANHDVGIVSSAAGCPVAGFFAAGEIGPVGKRTFIHGFTSSMIFFYEA